MIEARRQQRSFGDGLIAEATEDLWEEWMKHTDGVLEDEQLIETTYEALLRRRPKSRSRGRLGTPAEIVLRLLILKTHPELELRNAGAQGAGEPGLP